MTAPLVGLPADSGRKLLLTVRGIKDAMSRAILAELDAAGISIASATYEIVGLPPVRVEMTEAPR
jgi:hypothetical protein